MQLTRPALPVNDEAAVGTSAPATRPHVTRVEVLLLLGLVGAFLMMGLWVIARGAPLGHDESVYSLRAASYIDGSPANGYWMPYRAPGLPLLLAPLQLLEATAPYLRSAVLLAGAAGVVLTWVLGRQLGDGTVGILAAGMLALTPGYLMASVFVWPDVPGAVAGLAAAAVLTVATRDGRVSRALWWVVPFAVIATYIRFGAPVPLAAGLGTLGLLRWRTLIAQPARVAAVAATSVVAVAIVLFVPAATRASESPWAANQGLQSGRPFGASLADFASQATGVLGPIVGALTVLGVLLAVAAARRRQAEAAKTGLLAAIATFVGLVLVLRHGESRYLAPVLPFLFIAAAAGLVMLLRRWRVAAATGGALAVVAAAILLPAPAREGFANQRARFAHLVTASRELGEAAARPCVVGTGYGPQVGWYSDCAVLPYERGGEMAPPDVIMDEAGSDATTYFMLVESGKRQPEGDALNAYLEQSSGVVVEVGEEDAGSLQHIVVHQMEPSP